MFISYVGLLAGLALLIWLALRGVNIIFASVVCSLVVIVSNGLPLAAGLGEYYAFGSLGAFTFAGRFFLLFAAGAVFGRIMGESNAAASIALALVRAWGAHRALWITTLACAVLTYGGVVVFVVIFAMYPLGLRLLQEADIPKRLFCARARPRGGNLHADRAAGHAVDPQRHFFRRPRHRPLCRRLAGSVRRRPDVRCRHVVPGTRTGARRRPRRTLPARPAGPHPRARQRHQSTTRTGPWPWCPLVVVIVTIVVPRIARMLPGRRTAAGIRNGASTC